MKIYEIEKQADGSVKVNSVLSAEEMQAMLEIAMAVLLARGMVPVSVAKEMDKNQDQAQLEFLENVDTKEIPQA